MEYFHTEPCNDFNDFLSKVDKLLKKWWIFRGQQKDFWCLAHRFERACNRFGVLGRDRIRVEENMIREFRRRLYQYTANTPAQDAKDEWMALMQHHGAPTRLLDFTYSPYVAAYFAFEFADPNCKVAIWAVNAGWFANKLKNVSEEFSKKYENYRDYREKYRKYFNDIFMSKRPKKFLVAVNPFRLNERLAYQRGVFLCPGDVSVSLMDNLSVFTGNKRIREQVIKFSIPTGPKNENTIEALEILDSMNISRITLFPDLDGFAQSFEPRTIPLFVKQYSH